MEKATIKLVGEPRSIKRGFDFGQELSAKTGSLGFVKRHCLLEFQFGNGCEARFHSREFFFKSEKTFAAGRAVSLPLS